MRQDTAEAGVMRVVDAERSHFEIACRCQAPASLGWWRCTDFGVMRERAGEAGVVWDWEWVRRLDAIVRQQRVWAKIEKCGGG
jgi:hypothetical protein